MITNFEIAEKNDLPLGGAQFFFPGGAAADPQELPGLANITAMLLMRGTKKRSRIDLLNELERLGSQLDFSVNKNFTLLRSEVVDKQLSPFLSLIKEVLAEPKFAAEDLEKLKTELLAQLNLIADDDSSLIHFYLWPAFYPAGHRYAHPTIGNINSLKKITIKDVSSYYQKYILKNLCGLGIFGKAAKKLSKTSFQPTFKQFFTRDNRLLQQTDNSPPLSGFKAIFIEKPARLQNQIILASNGIAANDPDIFKLQIANTCFGGTFRSRISQELRDKRGLTYHASSRLPELMTSAPYYLQTFFDRENSAVAIELTLQLWQQYFEEGISEDELAHAKNYLSNSFPFLTDLPEKKVSLWLNNKLLGRVDDFFVKYKEAVENLSSEEINSTIRRRLNSKNQLLLVIGDQQIFSAIEKRLPAIKTSQHLPFDRLY